MFVDINIVGRNGSALIDTGVSDLFISEKAAKKLGLSIKKSNRKIKTINSEEGPTVGVVREVELQISEWKGKEEFEVIQLDDYDYVLGLNFLDMIQTVLYPWADQIHIVTSPLSKIVVPVYRDMKVRTKVLSSIQLVEDVSYGRNIDLIERDVTKSYSEVQLTTSKAMKTKITDSICFKFKPICFNRRVELLITAVSTVVASARYVKATNWNLETEDDERENL
ncbi:hypothetical protein GOBAR_AA05539 [Gossypium barbadense]|uniref:Peptidase A2 domain-containing protein n=1 Tax=Gossypium barbadense TaxID=3634 RepID=A0A2P5YHJ1_GOSBA|nr:hypothetical protein GOBAR_AA05539 [Gossypium barbadense]